MDLTWTSIHLAHELTSPVITKIRGCLGLVEFPGGVILVTLMLGSEVGLKIVMDIFLAGVKVSDKGKLFTGRFHKTLDFLLLLLNSQHCRILKWLTTDPGQLSLLVWVKVRSSTAR